MRKQNSDFEARFISEEGSRLKNRDYFGYVELDEFACYVIADGITEVTDVESARLAIETVILSFQENPSLSKRTVKRLLKRANRALLGKESDRRLKASITVVVTDYQKMRYGYVGNTRLRMYRGGAVYRQTRDMSLAQEMVEQEKIAKDELMQHEERNNLYAYLGQKNFKPVVSKKIKLAETDMIALYTRGIWENVDEAELDDVFAEADNEVQTTVDNIEDLLLSRQPENLDNYTLAVIFVNKVYQNPEKRKRIKKIVMITVIVVIAAIVIGVVLWFLRDRKVQRTEDMNYHFTNTVEYINTGNYVRAKEECEQAQKLAEKLKDSSMRNRLQEYSFVIETVILADESYSSADYEAAEEYYLSALDRTRYADNVGTDYIENKLENISVFLSVEDYINLGDSLLEQGDYDGAEEKYLLAKKAALSVHDAEGKQTAMDSLEKLYEEKADAESAAQEEADSQAQIVIGTLPEGLLDTGDLVIPSPGVPMDIPMMLEMDAEDKAFVMKIQDTVRAAVEEARFAQVVGKMQEAKAAQMDTHDVPAVVKLALKEFHITDSESTGVLQRLIESNDLTLYGLSNAVTRHSQDVESYDRASELESIGYSILTMPPRQWSRINRAAA